MAIVLENNKYTLSALPDGSRLLKLGKRYYHWTDAGTATARLTRIRPIPSPAKPLFRGNYWLFEVISNRRFTPGVHLSLVLRPGQWEAFLLPSGMPEKIGDSRGLQATDERIAWPQQRIAM